MTSTAITLTETDGTITVISPFHPAFAGRAKRLGGRWAPEIKAWRFDARDRAAVEALLSKLFGWTAQPSGETVTVRLDLHGDDLYGHEELRFAGRQVARRPQRDAQVILGEGVVLVKGGFGWRGGSVANPRIWDSSYSSKTIIMEVRDLPVEALAIVDSWSYTIVAEDPLAPLRAERVRLAARLAEIDAQLSTDAA